MDHVKRLGWAEELSKMVGSDNKLEDRPEVIKACKKNITNQGEDVLYYFLELGAIFSLQFFPTSRTL